MTPVLLVPIETGKSVETTLWIIVIWGPILQI
jgi:hypothetical protein